MANPAERKILKSILFRQICGNSCSHKFQQICRNSILGVPIEKNTLREEVYYRLLPSSYSWPAPPALSVRPQPPTPKWTSRGGSLIFSFGISPFPYQKEVSMWTGSTSSVEPGSSLDRLNKLCCARLNKLCWAWLLIGQNFVPDQSGARLNRACLLLANLRSGGYAQCA